MQIDMAIFIYNMKPFSTMKETHFQVQNIFDIVILEHLQHKLSFGFVLVLTTNDNQLKLYF
jgi:hypothetical protein